MCSDGVVDQLGDSTRDRASAFGWSDLCPMPGFGGNGGAVDRWNRWLLAWHAVFYALLASGVAAALPAASTAQALLAAGLSLLLAAWYGYWMVLRQDLMVSRRLPRVVYFAVAGLIWVGLLVTDRGYGILAFAAFPQVFGYLGGRAALLGAAAVSALSAAAGALAGAPGAPGGLRWTGLGVADVLDEVVVLAVVALLFAWIRDVVSQGTERQRLIDELQATRAELAATERQAGVLQERQRLAAEIHDTVTQDLASVLMLLQGAQTSLPAGSASADRVERALRTARDSLRGLRRLVWSLRPEALEEGSLAQALGRLASELSGHTGIAARTVVTGPAGPLPTEVEVTLLRAAQEALANVRRHARAREVTLRLRYGPDVVSLDVRDDGAGFDPAVLPPRPGTHGGWGLLAMRQRVERLGGRLAVESAPAHGTTVVVTLPVPHDTPADSEPAAT